MDQPRVVGAAPALMGAHSALDTCPGNARKPWGRPNLFLAGKSDLRPKGVLEQLVPVRAAVLEQLLLPLQQLCVRAAFASVRAAVLEQLC